MKLMKIGQMKMTKIGVRKMSDFKTLFNKQAENQRMMFEKGMYDSFIENDGKYTELPVDEPRLASYHIQQLMSEIGEVLDADKRWKNFRNTFYNKDAKLEELADCFVVLMNVAMFSGFEADDVYNAVLEKIEVVGRRIADNK